MQRKMPNEAPAHSQTPQYPSQPGCPKLTQPSGPSPNAPSPTSPLRQQASGAKLTVAEPASFGKFASLLMMYICKRILLVGPVVKLVIYLAVIFFLSLVTDHFPVPRSYFSNKRNFLNVYFVKCGWGWTSTIVGLFIYYTSHTYCCANRRLINLHLLRLAVGTSWWYISVTIFDTIHSTYGMCSVVAGGGATSDIDQLLTRLSCEDAGRKWIAFDVSGHAFLLIHCLLIISEEARCVGNGWERMIDTINREESLQRLPVDDAKIARDSHLINSSKIRWLTLALTLLTLLWEIMLFGTVLYFHNMVQKFVGAMFAVVGWLITYRFWYQFDTWWSPGLPGRGRFKFLKD